VKVFGNALKSWFEAAHGPTILKVFHFDGKLVEGLLVVGTVHLIDYNDRFSAKLDFNLNKVIYNLRSPLC
jgi:hypothetical protein